MISGTDGNDNLSGTKSDDVIHGNDGDDHLNAKAGNDIIHGGDGNDHILAGSGDDELNGGSGDDFLHGGAGTDTAVFTGSIKAYLFGRNGEEFLVSGPDGNDKLLHIEQLRFDDALITPGVNNAPIAVDDVAATGEDAGTLVGAGSVLDNDFDFEGDVLHAVAGTFTGAYGTLTLHEDGTYSYALHAGAQALAQGQVVQDVFAYTVTDGSLTDTGNLTINVTGANDGPVANPDTATTSENAAVTVDVLANDSDVDDGAVLTVTAASAPAGQGSASVVGNQMRFDPGADFDYLAVGESAAVAVAYTISDEHGATSSSTVAVTVSGANDAPTVDGANTDASGAVTELPNGDPNENSFLHQEQGVIAFDDVDLSDTHSAGFAPQGAGYLGTFSLDPVNQAGDTLGWDFDVSDAALDSLGAGQVVTQTYTITISDGNGGTTTQDVTITITGAADVPAGVWFIDNAAAGSANLGTQSDPFTSIAAFNAAQGTAGGPQAGHTVYLRQGIGTYAEADGINLLAGQILIGGGENLVVAGITYEIGSGRPTIVTTGAGNHGVELAADNAVSGFDIGSTTGAGIADGNGSVGTLSVANVAKSGSGQIVDIDQGGSVSITLNSAASTGSTGGAIDLNAISGSFAVSGATTITGTHSGGGLDVTASANLAVSLLGTLTAATGAGRAVNFSGNGGTTSLSITGGGMTLTTTTGTALAFQNGGSVTITGAGNSVTSGTGGAVNITNATIGAAGVTLQSVSSTGGTLAGINLTNAGTGGFTVTGLGSVAGSGGTVTNKTGADAAAATAGTSISITNTANVSLSNMAISNDSNFGILGSSVANFTLRDSAVTGNHGSNATLNESAVSFTQLTGTALFEGNTISGGFTENLRIVNSSGSLGLTIRDSASDQAVMGLNNLNGRDSVFISTGGTATLDLLIDGVDFLGARGDLLEIAATGSAQQDIVLTNNNFTNAHANTAPGGGGVLIGGVSSSGTVLVDYVVDNNDFTGARGSALTVSHTLAAGAVRGAIRGNVIGLDDGVSGAQGSSGGDGVAVSLVAGGTGAVKGTLLIQDNGVYDIAQGVGGIFLRAGGGSTVGALLEAVLDGNIVKVGSSSFTGLYAQVGPSSELGLKLTDNVIDVSASPFGADAVVLDQASTSGRFNFPGYTGSDDGELNGGTASVDLAAFLVGEGNLLINGGFPTYAGVDAGSVINLTNALFEQPLWP